jgi:hypothetical protein
MDHGGEALIGLVGTHGDAVELLELAEEVFVEMPPFVHLLVDGERLCATWMLGDDDLGAARVEFGDYGDAVECLVILVVMPVRAIHSTASTNNLLSLPRRPGSPGFPRQAAPSSPIGRQLKRIGPSAA